MSDDQYEIKYYPEICKLMRKYLTDALGYEYELACSMNKSLSSMRNEIHTQLGVPVGETYFPSLKTDIAFGIKSPQGNVALLLIEVKRGKTLGLMNFSQLVGYLQVAKHIKVGVLLLVNEGAVKGSPLSSDFSSIIDIEQLPADWQVMNRRSGNIHDFKTGICMYTVGNGIDWVDSDNCLGISSWEALKGCLT